MLRMMRESGILAIADDELGLTVDQSGHESNRNQCAGEHGNKGERCETLSHRLAPRRQPNDFHAKLLCATHRSRCKCPKCAQANTVEIHE